MLKIADISPELGSDLSSLSVFSRYMNIISILNKNLMLAKDMEHEAATKGQQTLWKLDKVFLCTCFYMIYY
jgi:hypothetical protein